MALTPQEQLYLAAQVAARAHRHQQRKDGTPYIAHPMQVAFRVAEHGPLAQAAALLHDVVEDTDITLEELREMGFDPSIIEAIDSVTKRPGESYLRDFIPRCKKSKRGKIIKLADIDHNLQDQSALDPDEAAFLTKRYTEAQEILNADN